MNPCDPIQIREYSSRCLLIFILLVGLIAFTSQAGAQSSNVIVGPQFDIHAGAGDQLDPRGCFDPVNHRFLVVWQDMPIISIEPGRLYGIFGQLIGSDGSPVGDTIPISTVSGSEWIDDGKVMDGRSKVLAYDTSSQRFLVVWSDHRNGVWNIYGQFVDANGTLSGVNFPISPIPPEDFQPMSSPVVEFDSVNNRFLVVGTRSPTSSGGYPQNLYGQLLNAGGSKQGALFQITDYIGDHSAGVQQISFNPGSGQFFAAWTKGLSASTIHGRLIDADGTLSGSEIDIGSSGTLSSMALDTVNHRYLAAWDDWDNLIRGQLVDSGGSLYGSELYMFDYLRFSPAIGFDPVSKKFLVAADVQNPEMPDTKIVGQLLNPDGSLQSSEFPILDLSYPRSGMAGSYPPYLVYGSEETGFLVLWVDLLYGSTGNDIGQDIFGKFVKISIQTCAGNLDHDTDVDGADLALLIANSSLADLATLAQNFGKNSCL